MKKSILFITLLCWACTKPVDQEAEKKSITKLIDDETKFAAAGDAANWASCWVNSSDAMFILASADHVELFQGSDSLASIISSIQPFKLKLERHNYKFTIGHDMAFVTFDQQDDMGGVERKTKESRTLRKIEGQWKILNTSVVDVSSYERRKTGSFHVAKEKLAVDPRTSFRNQHGLGGMAVGYVELPAGVDFGPMFVGLPQDMCPSPHWGYVLEGAMQIKYPGGKEETIKAGEVFYWPAPHTGKVTKGVKFIDFSPSAEFTQVMDHIANKIAEQKKRPL
jgi:hypothetical protein